MKLEDLEAKCDEQEARGLDALVLTMPAPKSWLKGGNYPNEVRSPFGLCPYTGAAQDGSIIIWPSVVQVRKFIAKARKEKFFRIIRIDDMRFAVKGMNLTEEAKLDPATLIGQRFATMEEAFRAIKWAAEELKKPVKECLHGTYTYPGNCALCAEEL